MDSFSLSLDERVRPWREAGLEYVFASPGTDRFASSRTQKREKTTAPYGPGAPAPRSGRNSQPAKIRKPSVPEPEQPARDVAGKPARPEPEWPNPWDVYKTSLKVPCRTVWTYWELGRDMGAEPSRARRDLLKKIMKHLHETAGWKKGSITFWPVAAISAKGLVPDAARFWKGVELTGASHIVIFGRRAFGTIYSERDFTYGDFQHDNRTIIVLPGPGDVLADRQGSKGVVWHALRDLDIR